MSEATAAATRKSAGAGIGKSSVTLYAPIASENAPATRRTIRPKSVELGHARYSRSPSELVAPCSPTECRSPCRADVTLDLGLSSTVTPQFLRRTTVVQLEGGGRGGRRRGRDLRRRGPAALSSRRASLEASPASTRSPRFSRASRACRTSGAGASRRRARPGAAAAGRAAPRGARPRAAAGALRRLHRCPRRTADICTPSGHALQARSGERAGTRRSSASSPSSTPWTSSTSRRRTPGARRAHAAGEPLPVGGRRAAGGADRGPGR